MWCKACHLILIVQLTDGPCSAHKALWDVKILHGDISFTNIMIILIDSTETIEPSKEYLGTTDRHHCGCLNDMDYAFDFSPVGLACSQQEDVLLHKTVSVPYLLVTSILFNY